MKSRKTTLKETLKLINKREALAIKIIQKCHEQRVLVEKELRKGGD